MLRKKLLLTAATVLMLIGTCTIVSADVNFDVSAYTDDELIEIMQIIRESETQLGYLYAGDVLKVGEDIPAGTYEFWVEEDDVAISDKMKEYDYHCGWTTLCELEWGDMEDEYNPEGYLDFYYDEYGGHKGATLEEGTDLWVREVNGVGFKGVRLKYNPGAKSGLFSKEE